MIGGCRIGRDVGDKGELLGGRSEEDVMEDSTVGAVNYNDYAKLNKDFWYTDKEQPIGLREAEVEIIFFFLSSRYNCTIFSAAFEKF